MISSKAVSGQCPSGGLHAHNARGVPDAVSSQLHDRQLHDHQFVALSSWNDKPSCIKPWTFLT